MAIFITPRIAIAQAAAAIWGVQLGSQTTTDVLGVANATPGGLSAAIGGIFDASYGLMSDADVAEVVVGNLGLTGAMADAGAAYIEAQLAAAAPGARGATVVSIVQAFSNLSTGDAGIDAAVAAFNTKVASAVAYGSTAGTADTLFGSVPAATSFDLSTGQDNLQGSPGADAFYAYIFDNQNTLQSGDRINGGAGYDTLEASMGNSSNFAILPITTALEAVFIRSQSNNWSGNNGDNNVSADPVADSHADDNTVDAELMQGVQEWWSTDSRADLVIEDIRILDNEITRDIAIGWRNADPSSIEYSNDDFTYADKVDYEVYFSPESLRKAGDTTSNAIQLTVGNQVEVEDFDPDAPLKDIPYTYVQFNVDGTDVALALDLDGVETYDDLWEVFSESFDSAKASGEHADLLADVTINRIEDGDQFFSRDGILRTADIFEVLKADGTISPSVVGWAAEGGLPSNNAFSANVTQGAAVTVSDLITSTIYLDNVGRESEAGDFVVGSMSTRTGVERFEITVLNNDNTSGAYTTSGSWVGEMRSTNNFLREVIAVNGPAGDDDEADYLYIGTGMDQAGNNLTEIRDTFLSTQSSIAGFAKYQAAVDAALLNTDGLQDVRVFDASEMQGKVKVGANITTDAIRKYQDLVDSNADDGFEDVDFVYSLGTSNDSINLELDAGLWDNYGGNSDVIPGRHDFNFTVDGNGGNDHILVAITSDAADGAGGEDDAGPWGGYDNWYVNQQINRNISVNGGAGDDTIRTPGAGDMDITGGTGNDTIYTDNTGGEDDYYYGEDNEYNDGRATWVFNHEDDYIYDLESQTAASVKAVNAYLTVDFRGYTKKVAIGNSVGATSNVTITDLTVNQAIKNAINDDAVLSKLLVAEDGPGRTLIVRSLIDGERDEEDLSVAFSNSALTASQTALGLVLFNPTSGAASMLSLLDGYESDFADGYYYTLSGEDSYTTSDNTIEGGTGNDVIVLSTTEYLTDWSDDQQEGSNETIVYTGFGNGTDTIVNFDTTYIPPGTPVYSGQTALSEVIRVSFSASDGTPAAQTIIFDGSTVNLSAPATQGVIPAIDVAYQFATNYVDADWAVTAHTVGTNTVTLTRVVPGALTDVVAADFTGTYKDAAATGGGGSVGITTLTQGRDAITLGTLSTFTVTFDVAPTAADAAGTFEFDGTSVAYAEGDGAITLAAKLGSASFANWTVTKLVNTVTFTAKAPGDTAIGVAADFDLGTNVIVGSVGGVVGAANVGTPIVTVSPGGPGAGFDYLDFSAYDPAGVMVNGSFLIDVAGDAFTMGSAAPNNQTYSYIRMTESATNEGWYTIDLVTVDDDTPVTPNTVQLIGVADFGDTAPVDFVPDNFIV